MRATFQNSGMVLSIGVFFSLLIVGLSSTLPHSMSTALQANGVTAAQGAPDRLAAARRQPLRRVPRLQPDAEAARQRDRGGRHRTRSSAQITGKTFFPHLIADPFMHGLRIAFIASMCMCLIAGAASWLRGGRVRCRGRAKTSGPRSACSVRPLEPGEHGDEAPEAEEWVPA